MSKAVNALYGEAVHTDDIIDEKLASLLRRYAHNERVISEKTTEQPELAAEIEKCRAAIHQYHEERARNPQALPDPCLLPDRGDIEIEAVKKQRKAQIAFLCEYARDDLLFAYEDGFWRH